MKECLDLKNSNFLEKLKEKKGKELDNKFLASYLAGFYESDGCLYIPSNKELKSNINLSFAFSKDDLNFAECLRDKFQMGYVKPKNNEHSCTWTIYKELDIFKLLVFINGYCRTPKIGILANGLNYFNNKFGTKVPILPLNNQSILEDGWFSGFTEGDASFGVNYVKDKESPTTISITPYYSLEVAKDYSKSIDTTLSSQSNTYFMTKLTETFSTKFGTEGS